MATRELEADRHQPKEGFIYVSAERSKLWNGLVSYWP